MKNCLCLLSVLILIAACSGDKQTPAEAASEVNNSIQALLDSVNTDCSALDLYFARCSIEKQADSIVESKKVLFEEKKKKLLEFCDSLADLKSNPSYLKLIEMTVNTNDKALNAIPADTWLINAITGDIRSICKFNSERNTISLYNFNGEIKLQKVGDVYKSVTNEAGYFGGNIFFESGEEYSITTWIGDSMVNAVLRPATESELYYGAYGDAIQLLPEGKAIADNEDGTYEIKDGAYRVFWESFNCKELHIQKKDKEYILYELWRKDRKEPRDGCHDVWSVMNIGDATSFFRNLEPAPRNILCLFGVDETYWKSSSNYASDYSDDWDDILDQYEKFVDNYVRLYKKAINGDTSAITEYASYLEKAESISKKLASAEGDLTTEQLNRYMNINKKMLNILE